MDLECDVPEKSAAAPKKNMADATRHARSKLLSDKYASRGCSPVSIFERTQLKLKDDMRNRI